MNGIVHHDAPHEDQVLGVTKSVVDAMPSNGDMVSKKPNGVNGGLEGAVGNGLQVQHPQNGNMKSVNGSQDLPQEVRHITETMFPLGMLIGRQVQECWNGLSELVTELADIPIDSQSNGVSERAVQQSGKPWGNMSEGNLQKKEKILKWAQDQRAYFIKIMVLSGWSSNMPEMHKAIDIYNWLREQLWQYDNSCDRMGYMRRDLAFAQVPNPDLKTAAEVLATGRLSSFPHLAYIKPQPLSPRKVLKTLRYINSLLCSRLALRHDIPLGFHDYHVHDGRVTFSVPFEFELDLSIADEDPESQFYFVAFRFLFSPCSNIPEGRLFDETASRANAILKADGLQGCYDFFHDLTISYKVNILFKQALEMSSGQWSGQLRVELVHRTLVMQYWRNQASAKSWVEIGVKSGRRKEMSGRSVSPGISFLDLRWMREGKEVNSEEIEFDSGRISLERTLRSVIAIHSSFLLESIYDRLVEHQLYKDGELSLEVSSSSVDPGDCYLTMQLTKARYLTTKIEPVTGNLALQPASQGLMREEITLNRSKNLLDDASARLAYLRCLIADQDLCTMASSAGWEHLTSFKPSQNDLRQVFPKGTLKQSFFRLPVWDTKWMLAVTHSMEGDSWWLIDASKGYLQAERLDTQPIHFSAALSYSYFTTLQEYVSGIVAVRLNCSAKESQVIGFNVEPPRKFMGTVQPVEMQLDVPSIVLKQDQQATEVGPGESSLHKVLVKISGLDPKTSKAQFHAHIKCTMPPVVRQLLATHGASSLRSSFKNSMFVLEYFSPVTMPIVGRLIEDLRSLNRLITYATVLATQPNIIVAHISLSCVAMIYSQNPHARLLLKFPVHDVDSSTSTALNLTLNPGNPHERIKSHLHHILTNAIQPTATNLSTVIRILNITFPLLSTLARLQTRSNTEISSSPTTPSRFHVLAVAPTQYTLHFIPPCPSLDLSIHLRNRNQKDLWVIRVAKPSPTAYVATSEASLALKEKLRKAVFAVHEADDESENKDPWMKMDQGAIVSVLETDAIERLLEKILHVVHEYVPARDPVKTEPKAGDKAKATTTASPVGKRKGAKAKEKEIITLD